MFVLVRGRYRKKKFKLKTADHRFHSLFYRIPINYVTKTTENVFSTFFLMKSDGNVRVFVLICDIR